MRLPPIRFFLDRGYAVKTVIKRLIAVDPSIRTTEYPNALTKLPVLKALIYASVLKPTGQIETEPAVIADLELNDTAITLNIGTIAIHVISMKNTDQHI